MSPRTMMRTVAATAALLVLGLSQNAFALDRTPEHHWDPKAPCYSWPAVDMDQDGVYDRIDHCPGTPKGCVVDERGCQTDADHDGVCDGLDQCPDTPAGVKVNKVGCSEAQLAVNALPQPQAPPPPPAKEVERPQAPPPAATPPVSEMEKQLVEGGRIRLENVYFETNSANLLPESEATLDEAGRTLEKFGALELEVEGHTDTRGSAAYNMRLSQARAESVRKYLLEHFSLAADHLAAKGYGETQPETKERNDEELLRNRRVVIKVLNPEALPRGVKIEQKD